MQIFFKRYFFIFFTAFIVSGLSIKSDAAQVNTTTLTEQRQIYLDASTQRWNVNSKSYQAKVKQLDQYPLLPYFQQRQLRRNLALKNEPLIHQFLDKHQGTPVALQLRKEWLDHLYVSNKSQRFIADYQPNLSNKLSCIYWQYQLDSGAETAEIYNQVTSIWLTAKSQPDECDPIFAKWKAAGYQTDELIWQRLMMARQKRQYLLAKYLRKQLPNEEQYLIELYKKLRSSPKAVAQLNKFTQHSKQESLVITYALKRLVWLDEVLALKVYQQAVQQQRFSPSQQQQILQRLTLAAARSNEPEAIKWYQSLAPEVITDAAKQWLMAKQLSNQDYASFLVQVEQLAPQKKNDRQWRYWHTRATQILHPAMDVTVDYKSLGKERSYYGFLAAARVGDPKSLNHNALTAPVELIDKLALQPAAQRAFELFQIDRFTQARREWDFWLKSLSDNEKLAAVTLAHQQGWYSQGIASLGKLGVLDDTDIRFPQPHSATFNKFAKQYKVDVAWAYAIARKESIFMSDAKSSVGALGLMQLMPSTANGLTNKKLSKWNILQVDTNVKLGINYLKVLLNRFDNNIVLATAAYNAGPGNVRKWLKAQPKLPADEWIETIPFKETREYVKSVLAYTEIYQQKYSKGKSPFKLLMTMEID